MVRSMLAQTAKWPPNSLYSDQAPSYVADLQVAKLRHLLVSKIEKDAASISELGKRCIELLGRVGLLCGSPEDLLMAAKYQRLHRVDLTGCLGPLLSDDSIL